MILKTQTYANFLFVETSGSAGFEYTKILNNDLDDYTKIVENVPLETFLETLLAQKNRLDTEGVSHIKIYHTIFYDFKCETEISRKAMALMQDLKATLCLSTESDIVNAQKVKFYELLESIRKRPGMYLGKPSITLLHAFLQGYNRFYEQVDYGMPSFQGFNDFIDKHYGYVGSIGWKEKILADCYGDEEGALELFFTLLDQYRASPNKPNSRDIVHRLLYIAFIHFRGESHEIGKDLMDDVADISENLKEIRGQLWAINRVADLLHNAANPLKNARNLYDYEGILRGIFDRARNYPYLHHWIKTNAPETEYYECELWSGLDEDCIVTTLIKSNHEQKHLIIGAGEKLIQTFFAINNDHANEIKEAFHERQAFLEAENKNRERDTPQ